jgi:hypothetical protein
MSNTRKRTRTRTRIQRCLAEDEDRRRVFRD